MNAPTTSGCSSTNHHQQQQQKSLHHLGNNDNNTQLGKRKSNKSGRGKACQTEESSVQKDINSIPDHILVSSFFSVLLNFLIRITPNTKESRLNRMINSINFGSPRILHF